MRLAVKTKIKRLWKPGQEGSGCCGQGRSKGAMAGTRAKHARVYRRSAARENPETGGGGGRSCRENNGNYILDSLRSGDLGFTLPRRCVAGARESSTLMVEESTHETPPQHVRESLHPPLGGTDRGGYANSGRHHWQALANAALSPCDDTGLAGLRGKLQHCTNAPVGKTGVRVRRDPPFGYVYQRPPLARKEATNLNAVGVEISYPKQLLSVPISQKQRSPVRRFRVQKLGRKQVEVVAANLCSDGPGWIHNVRVYREPAFASAYLENVARSCAQQSARPGVQVVIQRLVFSGFCFVEEWNNYASSPQRHDQLTARVFKIGEHSARKIWRIGTGGLGRSHIQGVKRAFGWRFRRLVNSKCEVTRDSGRKYHRHDCDSWNTSPSVPMQFVRSWRSHERGCNKEFQ